jgi:HEAT repeat protein
MKKRSLAIFCLLFFVIFAVFSQDAEDSPSALPGELQTYLTMYEGSTSWLEKQAILREVTAESPAGVEQFYAAVLHSMFNTYSSIRGPQDLNIADSIAKITVEKLGEAKYTAAAGDINKVVTTVKDSVVRSSAMIALGTMQAKEYLPQVIQILQDTNNLSVSQNRQPYEQLAYGAIVALDRFQDESGYLPVFFASRGWYGDWVKNQARESLPKISAEPWDLLISVITSPAYTVDNKRTALQVLDESSAGNSKKSEAASAGLAQTWTVTGSNNLERENIKDLRKASIKMLSKYGVEADSSYNLLERAYNGGDTDEKRTVIEALSVLANSPSVTLLSRFLEALNVKLRDSTLSNSDRAMVQALITALGRTGNKEARPALNSILSQDWTSAIKQQARASLQKIGS